MPKSELMRVDPEFRKILDQWKPDVSRTKQTSALAKEIRFWLYGKK